MIKPPPHDTTKMSTTKVGDPLELRLRVLAEKAAQAPKETKIDRTTEAEKNSDTLWYNSYPELFEIDYLRTLPRQDLSFTSGVQGLDLRQHVASHDQKEGQNSVLAEKIGFTGCDVLDKESLLLILKKSRLSLTSVNFHSSPIVSPDTLGYMMASFRKLTHFDLTKSNINDIHLQTIYQRPRYLKDGVNNAVAIETLCLKGNGGITDSGLGTMIKADACRWLQSLDVSECPNVSDMALLNFKDPRMFRHLHHLNLAGNHIGSLGVRQISLACKELLALNLSDTLIVDSTLGDIGV